MTKAPFSADSPPRLQMRGISKSYPGVQALAEVTLEVRGGEVLAVVGENGAGKSTLIKMLGGAHLPDSGSIEMEGLPVDLSTPQRAQRAGIGVIYQEFNLVPYLSARENLFLGRARGRWGLIDARGEREAARALLARLGTSIDPETPVSRLSIAERQIVEIAKALLVEARILVMDEPTATLTPGEVTRLCEIVRELRAAGIAILYISHRLDEVMELADRVLVLRDGRQVALRPIDEIDRSQMIELMVGRSLEEEFPPHARKPGATRLEVASLRWGSRVRDVSFDVRAGEVVGLTGLVGAGRTEVARLISGAVQPEGGTICVDGAACTFPSPRDAIRAGICLLSEDRQGEGLVLFHSVQENFGLPNLDHFSSAGILQPSAEATALAGFIDRLQIRIASPRQQAGQLSGGNQQKLVLAKWLERDCGILVIDEPTRGIDVGAKFEIYQMINQLAEQGKAVIMISSEIPEVLAMSDRVLVMREGRIVGELHNPGEATQEEVMALAAL